MGAWQRRTQRARRPWASVSDALQRMQRMQLEYTQLLMFRAYPGAAAECGAKRRCSRLLGSAQIRRFVLDNLPPQL